MPTPEEAMTEVNRVYREFKRYTGDGLPNEPTGAPLPVGDPQSGPHNPKKSELRAMLVAVLLAAGESVSAVEAILAQLTERYLGAHPDDAAATAAAGGAPITGAQYWSTSENRLKTWDGDSWAASDVALADGSVTDAKLAPALKGRLVAFAPNRSALAAFDGATYQAVDLMEAGRKGMFHWQAGDLSAEVAADTAQGIYVAPASDPTGASGAWVRRFDGPVRLNWFGAVGDGVADDAAAVRGAIRTGLPLDWGKPGATYRMTTPVVETVTADVLWTGAGRVLYDAPSPTQHCININAPGRNIQIDADLIIDANKKAFHGLFLNNNTDTYADCFVRLKVRNVYRASTAFTGGTGIHIQGAYDRLELHPHVVNVTAASGAIVPGAEGPCGFIIKAASTAPERAPRSIAVIAPYIENISSENAADNGDMDGCRIFAAEDDAASATPRFTRFSIVGGEFRDCWGRSIKAQSTGVVSGTTFVRTDGPTTRSMPEIDFQTGSGTVENIECFYSGSRGYPDVIVTFQGTRRVGGQNIPGGSLRGLKLSMNGGGANTISSIVAYVTRENLRSFLHISDIQHIGGTTQVSRLLNMSCNGPSAINIDKVSCRTNTSFVSIAQTSSVTIMRLRDIWQYGPTVPALSSSGAGTVTSVIDTPTVIGLS